MVDQTITGCETTKGHVKRGAVEFWATMDKYNLKHKEKNSKRPPSSFLKVFPLNTNLKPKDIEEEARGDGDHRGEKECMRASQKRLRLSSSRTRKRPQHAPT